MASFKKEEKGFILLQTLIFLSLITAIVLSHIECIILEKKQLTAMHRYSVAAYELEDMIRLYVKRGPSGQTYETGRVKRHNKMYQVTWRYLGFFPCLYALGTQQMGTKHWLLRIKSFENAPGVGIEVRMARASSESTCNHNTSRWVPSGILSWRKIK